MLKNIYLQSHNGNKDRSAGEWVDHQVSLFDRYSSTTTHIQVKVKLGFFGDVKAKQH